MWNPCEGHVPNSYWDDCVLSAEFHPTCKCDCTLRRKCMDVSFWNLINSSVPMKNSSLDIFWNTCFWVPQKKRKGLERDCEKWQVFNFWVNFCLNHIVVCLIAVSGFCMSSMLNNCVCTKYFTLLTCHEFCGFSAGVCLCFHNLATCSPCPYCVRVCFAVVLANSHLADKSCSLWHGYSGLFMSIGWCFLKEWFLIESAETHLSPDWLREEESLVWLDQTPQIP